MSTKHILMSKKLNSRQVLVPSSKIVQNGSQKSVIIWHFMVHSMYVVGSICI